MTTPPTPPSRPRREMTDQAAVAAIVQACLALRLPTVRARARETLVAAEKEHLTHQRFLAERLLTERDDRDRHRFARTVKAAGFPRDTWFGDVDVAVTPSVNPFTSPWVRAGHPLCLIGGYGTGKSHLLINLGTAAAEAVFRVKHTPATKLVNKLGCMALDRRGAELLFQVRTEREGKNSVAIASNESFSGWTKTFTNPRFCATIVDRLTHTLTAQRHNE